jgi:Protein of unknown function (DUF3780)
LLARSFGFDPAESSHFFLVSIPKGGTSKIDISEHFTWDYDVGPSEVSYGQRHDGQLRVQLVRPKWDAIADDTRAEFNRRLKRMSRKPGIWQAGSNLVRAELGKELMVLAWAIEDADPGLIPTALANWHGLVPEERWWLYTQTAAATGHGVSDRARGWRKALRYALTENPVSRGMQHEPSVPEFFRRAAGDDLFGGLTETRANKRLRNE